MDINDFYVGMKVKVINKSTGKYTKNIENFFKDFPKMKEIVTIDIIREIGEMITIDKWHFKPNDLIPAENELKNLILED